MLHRLCNTHRLCNILNPDEEPPEEEYFVGLNDTFEYSFEYGMQADSMFSMFQRGMILSSEMAEFYQEVTETTESETGLY